MIVLWIAVALVALGVYVFRLLRRWEAAEQAAQTVSQAGQTPGSASATS